LKLYSEGNPEFEAELKKLITNNLDELNMSAIAMLRDAHVEEFLKVLHKCKTSLSLVESEPLNQNIVQLRKAIDAFQHKGTPLPDMLVSDLNVIITDIKTALG
jgi:hypothetical protein